MVGDMAYNMLTPFPTFVRSTKTKRELVQSLHDAEIMIHKHVSSEGTCKYLANGLQQRRDNASTKANQVRHSIKSQITGQTLVLMPLWLTSPIGANLISVINFL